MDPKHIARIFEDAATRICLGFERGPEHRSSMIDVWELARIFKDMANEFKQHAEHNPVSSPDQ